MPGPMSAAWEPLVTVLRRRPPALPLHLPAHGRGRALASPLRRLLRLSPGRWDLPELPVGVYLLRWEQAGRFGTKRIVVQ